MTQSERVRIGFVDVGYLRGHRGKVPIEYWAPNRVGELRVVADSTFSTFEVEDEYEFLLEPREDPAGLDIHLENWSLNYDIIVSWNGLFGDYLALARLSDEISTIVPKSVDLFRQLALDVEDVFPAKKKWPGAGLQLEKVHRSFGNDLALGRKYRGDSTLEDCWRIFEIYEKLLAGHPLNYEHVAYSRSFKTADDRAIIPASQRTLGAMRGVGQTTHLVQCDVDWSKISLPASVSGLIEGCDEWDLKPALRYALQLLSPSVNERVRNQLAAGQELTQVDLDRLRAAIELTP